MFHWGLSSASRDRMVQVPTRDMAPQRGAPDRLRHGADRIARSGVAVALLAGIVVARLPDHWHSGMMNRTV